MINKKELIKFEKLYKKSMQILEYNISDIKNPVKQMETLELLNKIISLMELNSKQMDNIAKQITNIMDGVAKQIVYLMEGINK